MAIIKVKTQVTKIQARTQIVKIQVKLNKVISGGDTAWGAITGVLSSQLDLQNALDDKADSVYLEEQLAEKASATDLDSLSASKVSKTGDDLTGKVTILSNANGRSLEVLPTGDSGSSSSSGGAVLVDMTDAQGAGLTVYSNKATSSGHLVQIRSNQDSFDKHALFVDYKGENNAVNVKYTAPASTPVAASAFNMSSDNQNGSAVQVRGKERALGTIKVTHENPSTTVGNFDSNAAALSVDVVENSAASGVGTAAQGLYIDSTTGTTGKLLTVRNSGLDLFAIESDGRANFNSKRLVNVATPTANSDAANKDYVDSPYSWTPLNYNYISWNYDPAAISNTTLLTPGTLNVIKLRIPRAATISNIILNIGSAGATLTNAYVALYQNGALLAQSLDQSASWTSTGNKVIPITQQNVAAGTIDIVVWFGTAGTAQGIARGGSQAGVNGSLTGANLRWSTANTGITTTAPATLGTRTTSNNTLWCAVS